MAPKTLTARLARTSNGRTANIALQPVRDVGMGSGRGSGDGVEMSEERPSDLSSGGEWGMQLAVKKGTVVLFIERAAPVLVLPKTSPRGGRWESDAGVSKAVPPVWNQCARTERGWAYIDEQGCARLPPGQRPQRMQSNSSFHEGSWWVDITRHTSAPMSRSWGQIQDYTAESPQMSTADGVTEATPHDPQRLRDVAGVSTEALLRGEGTPFRIVRR